MRMFLKTLLVLCVVSFFTVNASGKTIMMNMEKEVMERVERKAMRLLVPRQRFVSLPKGTQTKYFEVEIDHFGFALEKTFKMKYLINQAYWKSGGPIFFYTGNEGSIELFANNTGLMWEIAPSYKAMLVFAEHRYYGASKPFGSQSFKDPSYFGYLTAEQALADYAELLRYLKQTIKGAAASPVIAFGGSYGGMLSAWMRLKYPNIIAGSIAASAPVLMFTGEEKLGCEGFNLILTHSYTEMGTASCSNRIRSSWQAINGAKVGDLTRLFRLCSPLKHHDDLTSWLQNAIVDIGMANYPYPTDFLAHLPAWPVKAFCDRVNKGKTPIEGMALASQVYYNSTGRAKCLNLTESQSPSLDSDGWNYQSCMEMVMPICASGKTMFLPSPWNLTNVIKGCQASMKVTPRPLWIPLQFGGQRLAGSASNILFSNGALDPWAAGGIKTSPDATRLPVIVIKDGAHHLDLRASNRLDPASVKAARKIEMSWISKWIKQKK